MLSQVTVGSLKPNPFRRLDEYPIIREKVDALRESIASTGFWGTVVARKNGKGYEIAFGHHRLIALQEECGSSKRVEVIVRDLTNEQMLQMMARENMEEWGTSAWVELETIRSVIEAYGNGDIQLPKIPDKTSKNQIQYAYPESGTHPYTKASIAEFLGWTKPAHSGDTVRPNAACETAFRALEMIDKGFIKESDLRGLSRRLMAELISGQWSIYQANMRNAEQSRKDADAATKAAEEAEDTVTKRRLEKRAEVSKEQAEHLEFKAKNDAKSFGKRVAEEVRSGKASCRDIREQAQKSRPSLMNECTIDLTDLAKKTAILLGNIANGDDQLSASISMLKKHAKDVSPSMLSSLDQSFGALISRLEKMRSSIKVRV